MSQLIFGLKGHKLSEEESIFFRKTNPAGFILFSRNFKDEAGNWITKDQIKELTTSLKDLFPDREVLVLIDQEGGKVQRLNPHIQCAKDYPPAAKFGQIAKEKTLQEACEAVYENYFELASELYDLGINANCAPCADLYYDFADKVIGDRSFSHEKDIVVALCQEVIKAHLDAGVDPVIKHMPGHGRALADSHLELPIVTTPLSELEDTDFAVFKALCETPISPFAMTAHVVFTAIDSKNPITISPAGINYIREKIGFVSGLITDDLSMNALPGSIGERAVAAKEAGCDYLLHCNGNMAEMIEIAGALGISLEDVA